MRPVSDRISDNLSEFQALMSDSGEIDKESTPLDQFSELLDEIASRVMSNFINDRTQTNLNAQIQSGELSEKREVVDQPRAGESQERVATDSPENGVREGEKRDGNRAANDDRVVRPAPDEGKSRESSNESGKKAAPTGESEVKSKQDSAKDAPTEELTRNERGPLQGATATPLPRTAKEGKVEGELPAKLEQLYQRIQEQVQESTPTSTLDRSKQPSAHEQQQRVLLEQALREMMKGQHRAGNEITVQQPGDLASALASMISRSQISSGMVQGLIIETSSLSANSGTTTHQAIRELGAAGNLKDHNVNRTSEELLKKMEQPLRGRLAVHTMERVEQVLQEAARSRDGKTISLRLDPPDLGKLRVDVSMRDGALHARLSADSQQVSLLLREKSFELQRMLRGLGLDVEQVTVSVRDYNGVSSQSDGGDQSFSTHSGRENSEDRGDSMQGDFIGTAKNKADSNLIVEDHWVA